MDHEPTQMQKKALFLAANGQRIYDRGVRYMVEKHLKVASEVTQKSPHVLTPQFRYAHAQQWSRY